MVFLHIIMQLHLICLWSSDTNFAAKKLTEFEQDFMDLVEGKRSGHMGEHCFANGGLIKFEELIEQHPEYYITLEEQALIERCGG